MRRTRSLVAAGIAGTLLAGLAVSPSSAEPVRPEAPVRPADRTNPIEARRVDQVATPQLDWSSCHQYAECATVALPLDYDEPQGSTVDISVLRVPALDPQRRIGSLFVNPGLLNGSGTLMALEAPNFLGTELLDRFDIVGFDSRGVGGSTQVRCFRSSEEQAAVLAGMAAPFPLTEQEEAEYLASSKALGRACSTTGGPLAGAMSTSQMARDMDVLRRAVGDQKLSYFGSSYGSLLGQYYANIFPDRFRAVAIDGVISAEAWVGGRIPWSSTIPTTPSPTPTTS